MNLTQYFKLALNSLRTSKMRAFLTMLGIIIGVAAVIVIISLGNGLRRMVDQQAERLGTNLVQTYIYGRGDGTTMDMDPQRLYELVAQNPDVLTGVSPYLGLSGTSVRVGRDNYGRTKVSGVSEAFYRPEERGTLEGERLARGRFLGYIDVERAQHVCVIGAYLAQKAFRGDPLGQQLMLAGEPYTVIGVLEGSTKTPMEGGDDDRIYISYQNALRILGIRSTNYYMFTATSRDTAPRAKEIIDKFLRDFYQISNPDDDPFYTYTMAEQVYQLNVMMGVAMAILVSIAAISLLVGGIGIMNIMLVSVTERTREIGIRKSLGAKRRDIRWQFLIEAGTTSAAGGLLGIALGCLVAGGIGALLGGYVEQGLGGGATFTATPTPAAVLVSFGVSVGIGMLFGYLPANKAAKLNPIDALRYD